MPPVKSIDRVVEAKLRDAAFDWEGAPHAVHMACQEPLRQEPCRPAVCVAGVEGNNYLWPYRIRKLSPVDGVPGEDQPCIVDQQRDGRRKCRLG